MAEIAVLPIPDDPSLPLNEPDEGRWAANLVCMWHLCERTACRKARACRGDPDFCMKRYHLLLPPLVRDFVLGVAELGVAGWSSEQIWAELVPEREHLAAWQACVAHVGRVGGGP